MIAKPMSSSAAFDQKIPISPGTSNAVNETGYSGGNFSSAANDDAAPYIAVPPLAAVLNLIR
jgi:hypothetical protein